MEKGAQFSNDRNLSKSNVEEIIGILWLILSLMLIDRGYIFLGKIAFCLGLFATLCSIIVAIRNARRQALKVGD